MPDARRRTVTRVLGPVLAAGSLALVAACGSGASPAPSASPTPTPAPTGGSPAPAATPSRTLTVVASTNVWGSIVGAVAGPGVEVRSIITDPAADPHSYESTPADAAAISAADLVVANGGGYDEFVDRVTASDAGVKAKTIEAFDLRSDPSTDNEHVWFDAAAVKGVVGQVVDRLAAAEPAQADALRGRGAAFDQQVDGIEGRLAAIGQARPGVQTYSTEPIAFYLLRSAGMTDVTPESFLEAVENETDPSAASLVEVGDGLTARRVGLLVFNPQTETPVIEQLRTRATDAGVPVVDVTETLPAGQDYLQWLDGNRTALARAVGAPA